MKFIILFQILLFLTYGMVSGAAFSYVLETRVEEVRQNVKLLNSSIHGLTELRTKKAI